MTGIYRLLIVSLSFCVLPATAEEPPVAASPTELKAYPLPPTNADDTVKELRTLFRDSKIVRISTVGGKLLVYGTVEDQQKAQKILKHLVTPVNQSPIEIISLVTLDATSIASTLRELYPKGAGAPIIVAETSRNVLLVRGNSKQIKEIQEVISALDQNPPERKTIILALKHSSVAEVSKILPKVYSFDGPSMPNVVVDERTNSLIVSASPKMLESVQKLVSHLDVKIDKK